MALTPVVTSADATSADATSADDGRPDPAAASARRRRIARPLAAVTLVALTAGGYLAWHLPTDLYAERPGPLLHLDRRIRIDSREIPITPINGELDGLTVRLQSLDLGPVVQHYLTDDPATIVTANEIHPPFIDDATYQTVEKAAYVDGGQIAAAVAERKLGYSVTVSTDGLDVFAVTPGSAADGVLTAGDRISDVNGSQIDSQDDLKTAVQASDGRAITLTLVAGAGTRDVTVTPRPDGPDGALILGVSVSPAAPTVDLQIPVAIDAQGVEGPSAGLMTALTVYDELSPTDVANGRRIAGTGTLTIDGTVGEIGGIEAKARAAAAARVDMFLAPASQAAAAREVLGDAIPVIPVTTFDQALAALTAGATAAS